MTKFVSLDDPGFFAVVGEIRRWTKNLARPSTGLSTLPSRLSQPILCSSHPPISHNIDLGGALSNPSQIMPMYQAVADDNVDAVQMLLDAGISANDLCYRAIPPLCLASQSGNIDIAKLLIGAGADVNIWNGKPLFAAATKGHVGLVRLLLASGASPNAAPTLEKSWTALHAALIANHPDIAKVLIDTGANVNAVSITGVTPLLIADRCGYSEIVTALLAKGATAAPENSLGCTASNLILEHGKVDISRKLIEVCATV